MDVVHKILSQKPPDVVDNFEQYSWQVKQEKFRPNFDLLNDIYLAPPQLALIRRMDEMFRVFFEIFFCGVILILFGTFKYHSLINEFIY